MEPAPLPADLWPLLNKFYREQRSSMRGNKAACAWVTRRGEIVAALNLTPVDEGYWLTGLLVAEACRGQGLAHELIQQAVASVSGPVWLFCDPGLAGFYQRSGFVEHYGLPQVLNERLVRYQRTKALIAMARL
ncbi:GNAT family N-acetyltransferase [Pseudomonas eucalypticola]|nr:GNAT family N-acetyltransferase [Pseudomonas eucalypticola]